MKNIPIFIPHLGCKNDCAFCNQHSITGLIDEMTVDRAKIIIEEHLKTIKGDKCVAFFGGSFTGLERNLQNSFLAMAKSYLDSGDISRIRLSTRPDYISEEIVDNLLFYGVTNVELGAQSLFDDVLLASKRGHTKESVINASKIIKKTPITLGLQMMTGLPLDNPIKDMETAKQIVSLGALETRIYPTLVLKGTYLEKMYRENSYSPQTLEEAVSISAKLYKYFTDNNVTVLRVGLMNSTSLESELVKGPYSPNFGELCLARVLRNELEERFLNGEKNLTVKILKRNISRLYINKHETIKYLENLGASVQVFIEE